MTCAGVGVHVLDTHVLRVESIPEGSEGALVETIRMSPAGTAGGTGVVLGRLGASVHSIGAVGDDPIGATLVGLLDAEGVDTSRLLRRTDSQTSASVLPVRPNGDRPAWHVVGAHGTEIGRASCRERVCQYVSIPVVAVSLKKKKPINTR